MRTDLEMLVRVTDMLTEAVSVVHDDALDEQTPCDAWDVAALLDHLTGGNRFTAHVLAGKTADEAIKATRASFAGDSDKRLAVVESAATQLAVFREEGVMVSTYHHVVGDLTGEHILRLRMHDMSIHRWDLLQAVNPKKGLDSVYVRWAIDELARPDSLAARHMATGYPEPSKSYELLLAFGRRRARPTAHLRPDE